MRFSSRNPDSIQPMDDEGKRDDPRMRRLADRFVKPAYEALRARVERAQVAGCLAGVPPASLHYLVLGAAGLACSQAAKCTRVTAADPRDPAFADAILRLLGAS